MDEQQETSLATTGQARLVHRLAVTFYGVAAAAAVIGQTWVAVDHLPWPDTLAPVWRVAAVLPFALVLELLAVVLATMSDHRMRLGERAVGIRSFSAAVAVVATGVIVIGHGQHDLYLAIGFGALSGAAYLLALVHMSMRRRDALRAAGQLAAVAPAYGLYRRLRNPVLTARAAELARERGLGLYESLRAAEAALRAERRRPAIAAAVEAAIRSSHDDPRMAEIAVSTLDLDRIADELAATADYAGWAAQLAPAVTAPPSDMSAPETGHEADMPSGHGADTEADMSAPRKRTSERTSTGHGADMSAFRKRTSTRTSTGHRRGKRADMSATVTADDLRELLDQHPDMTKKELANVVGLSDRQVRRILRAASAPQADIAPDMSASGSGHGPDIGADMDGGHVRLNGHAMSA